MIEIKHYNTTKLYTNTYLIIDGDVAAIIDPGNKNDEIDRFIESFGKEKFKYILLTHGHFDHITAAERYKNMTNASICISEAGKEFLTDNSLNLSYKNGRHLIEPFYADILLNDGDILEFGKDSEIKAIYTPGHTISDMCFLINKNMFSGDLLFKESVGRTDLPTSDSKKMEESIKKVMKLEDDVKVYPGHGDFSTIGEERLNNLYCQKVLLKK